jgi:hypothetical protein
MSDENTHTKRERPPAAEVAPFSFPEAAAIFLIDLSLPVHDTGDSIPWRFTLRANTGPEVIEAARELMVYAKDRYGMTAIKPTPPLAPTPPRILPNSIPSQLAPTACPTTSS